MRHIPKTMFKYCKSGHLKALENCMVRYTPLGEFNDIFEAQPLIDSLYPLGMTLKEREELICLMHQKYCEDFKSRHGSFLRGLYSDEPFVLIEAIRDHPGNLGVEEAQYALDFLKQKLDKQIGAFCLSEVPDSLLMWAHYAEEHSGFLLEFDTRYRYFNCETDGSSLDSLLRVQYREARPRVHLTGITEDVFLCKSSHWSYEREWRIFRSLDCAHKTCPDGKGGICHLFGFPPETLLSVTLGARSSSETREGVEQALAGNQFLKHVEIKCAVPDPSHFLLRIIPWMS